MDRVPPNVTLLITEKDFGNICRFCLKQGPLASIFDLHYEECSFPEILFELFSTQVNSQDGLPKNVCENCISEIVRFYDFRKVFKASEKTLQVIIAKELNKTIHRPFLYSDNIKLEEPDINETFESNDQVSRTEDRAINVDSSDEDEIQMDTTTTDNIDTIDNFLTEGQDTEKMEENRISETSCQKTFAPQSEYIGHRKEEKHPLLIDHTSKLCAENVTKPVLNQHVPTHSEEKPYKCKICSASFKQSGNLSLHMMNHTAPGSGNREVMEPIHRIVYTCKAPFCRSAVLRKRVNMKSFFRFPRDLERRRLWKQFCGIDEDFDDVNNYRLCGDHFRPSDFMAQRRISMYAVPSRRSVALPSDLTRDHDYCLGDGSKEQEVEKEQDGINYEGL